ncbi:hypothetical protein K490DRAFT_8160, partial [Saccharata proteae CBS 121410]
AQLQQQQQQQQQEEEAAARLPIQPPLLPSPPPLPTLNTFGGDDDASSISPPQFRTQRAGYPPQGYHFSRPSMSYRDKSHSPQDVPVPPLPHSSPGGEYVDPYARTESMTHRGRYSYASSAVSSINSPRRVRRRKDPTPFNILIIGAKNSGKTSFINFLESSLKLPSKRRLQTPPPAQVAPPDSPFTSQYLETEIDNERIGLTLWDSRGLEKNIVDLQLREMTSFIESKFEETFTEEQKVVRAAGVRDTHIHCVFILLDPSRLDSNTVAARKANANSGIAGPFAVQPRLLGVLDEDLDLQVLRALQGRTTVIPVISKADTITTAHMSHLKKTVWDSLRQAKLDPLEALNLDEDDGSSALDERDEDEYLVDRASDSSMSRRSSTSASSPPPQYVSDAAVKHRRRVSAMSTQLIAAEEDQTPYLPLSIISPDMYEPGVVGRKFPWGFADPLNTEHCDFLRLKESVFSEWRTELREASRDKWYEGWRTSRLKKR